MYLAVAFGALLVLALFVTFVLPVHVAAPPFSPAVPDRPIQAQPSTASTSRTQPHPSAEEAGKSEAAELLREARRRLVQLESIGVRIWGIDALGGASLPTAQSALDKASDLYDRGQYVAAAPLVHAAMKEFAQLAESVPERFRLRMAQGQRAFDSLDADAAISHFEIAVALQPDDARATKYLQRARVLPQVVIAVDRGLELEKAGALDQAREMYQKAVSLDSAFAAGQEGVARVGEMVVDRDYRHALSDAISNLDRGDFKAASSAAKRAEKLKGATAEVTDILDRIQSVTRTATLDTLRKKALALEEGEKWAEAMALYERALRVEKDTAFAVRGRNRAQRFADLHTAIDRYLAEPQRLQSPAPLAHAKTVLVQARPFAAEHRVLHSKTNLLEGLINRAEMPIRVSLKSDMSTHVTIYRVGSLGAFSEQTIELRPGAYIGVGSRPGYRDVRVEFAVSPAQPGPVVTIQCAEPIAFK